MTELRLALVVSAIRVEALLEQVQKSEAGGSAEALVAMDQDTLPSLQLSLDELERPVHHIRVEERGAVSVDHVQYQPSASEGIEILWTVPRSPAASIAERFAVPGLLRALNDAPERAAAHSLVIKAVSNEESLVNLFHFALPSSASTRFRMLSQLSLVVTNL